MWNFVYVVLPVLCLWITHLQPIAGQCEKWDDVIHWNRFPNKRLIDSMQNAVLEGIDTVEHCKSQCLTVGDQCKAIEYNKAFQRCIFHDPGNQPLGSDASDQSDLFQWTCTSAVLLHRMKRLITTTLPPWMQKRTTTWPYFTTPPRATTPGRTTRYTTTQYTPTRPSDRGPTTPTTPTKTTSSAPTTPSTTIATTTTQKTTTTTTTQKTTTTTTAKPPRTKSTKSPGSTTASTTTTKVPKQKPLGVRFSIDGDYNTSVAANKSHFLKETHNSISKMAGVKKGRITNLNAKQGSINVSFIIQPRDSDEELTVRQAADKFKDGLEAENFNIIDMNGNTLKGITGSYEEFDPDEAPTTAPPQTPLERLMNLDPEYYVLIGMGILIIILVITAICIICTLTAKN